MTDNKSAKIVLEREYNIPLRRKWLLVPKYKRAKKAIKTLKDFMMKHMKSDNVKIGRYLNMNVWKDGIKNPPHHVLVIAKKDEEGIVTVELKSAPAAKGQKTTETKKVAKETQSTKSASAPAKTTKTEEKVVEKEVVAEKVDTTQSTKSASAPEQEVPSETETKKEEVVKEVKDAKAEETTDAPESKPEPKAEDKKE